MLAGIQSCKKAQTPTSGGTSQNTPPVTSTGAGTGVGTGPGGTIVSGTDPATTTTQGFFLDNWSGKTFTAPNAQTGAKASESGAVSVTVDLSQVITKASPNIYGNNINPFMGQVITDATLMSNITAL